MQNFYNLIENNLFWFLVFPYILTGILVLVISTFRIDKTHSISKLVANNKKLLQYFALFATFGSIPVYLLMSFYLLPKYQVNQYVSISVLLMYLCQNTFAIIPDSGGRKSQIHELFAWAAGFLTVIYWTLILIFGTMDLFIKFILLQNILIMCPLFCLVLFIKKMRKYIFYVEVMFLVEWIITIFCLSFR